MRVALGTHCQSHWLQATMVRPHGQEVDGLVSPRVIRSELPKPDLKAQGEDAMGQKLNQIKTRE